MIFGLNGGGVVVELEVVVVLSVVNSSAIIVTTESSRIAKAGNISFERLDIAHLLQDN